MTANMTAKRVAFGALLAVAVVAPLAFVVFQRAVQPAEPPAFYTPPRVLPDGPPGTVIRDRAVTSGSGSDGVRVWRVLHTSTGPDGEPIAVSAMVAAPVGSPPGGGWPVVAWAHGTTGVASRCAPSLDDDAGVGLIPGFAELVAAGHVVVATDYVGLGTPGPHPYLIGESAGRAVLDSIRAARSLLEGDVSADAVIFGHSQGGHSVLFAAELAPDYASELRLLGAAPMAPPTDLGELMQRDIGEPAGLLLTALAVASWSQLFPEADEDAIVYPEARPFVEQVGEDCVLTTIGAELAELPDIVALGVVFLSADPATAPGWSTLLATNSPGTVAVETPMLVSQGLADTLVRPDITTSYVDAQCRAGAAIEFNTYAGVGHFDLRTAAAPAVVAWLQARLAETPAAPGCTTVAKP